jgi:hypothetical protein
MTETEKFVISTSAAVLGSGLGTAIIGAVFKRWFDIQLETHKALLMRSTKIHELQVDALLVIYSKLEHALFYLQRASSAGKLAGEPQREELLERMGLKLAAASEEYSQKMLLINPELTSKLDHFFKKVLSAGIDIRIALDPVILDGAPRAKMWDAARETAFRELPAVLAAIRTEARTIIHGSR